MAAFLPYKMTALACAQVYFDRPRQTDGISPRGRPARVSLFSPYWQADFSMHPQASSSKYSLPTRPAFEQEQG
jgi:hypothetical protein